MSEKDIKEIKRNLFEIKWAIYLTACTICGILLFFYSEKVTDYRFTVFYYLLFIGPSLIASNFIKNLDNDIPIKSQNPYIGLTLTVWPTWALIEFIGFITSIYIDA